MQRASKRPERATTRSRTKAWQRAARAGSPWPALNGHRSVVQPSRRCACGGGCPSCLARRAPSTRWVQRKPKVAGVEWTVRHADVAAATEEQLTKALEQVTGSLIAPREYVAVTKAILGATWSKRLPLYVKAIDFLRDNRHRFELVEPWETVRHALAYCDAYRSSGTSLGDAFYEELLTTSVYGVGNLVWIKPLAWGGATYPPKGRDAVLRPSSRRGAITGRLARGTDLLVSYGAQPGAVGAGEVDRLLAKHAGKVPPRLRPHLRRVGRDGTIFRVLKTFLEVDKGAFEVRPVHPIFGARYNDMKPPSIYIDPETLPGSGTKREDSPLELRVTLAHELFHYGLGRVDAEITEVGKGADHDLIDLVDDRLRIVQLIQGGHPPISGSISALHGFSGGDKKRRLRALIAGNDAAGLTRAVEGRRFLEDLVLTQLTSTKSRITRAALKSQRTGWLPDPAQVSGLAYVAAINAALIKTALRLAAETSRSTGLPLRDIWKHPSYRRRVDRFVSMLIALASENRSRGVTELLTSLRQLELIVGGVKQLSVWLWRLATQPSRLLP